MTIMFAHLQQFSQVEREAVAWLGERGKWLRALVKRRSDREFDLGIEGEYDGDDGYEYGPATPVPCAVGQKWEINRRLRGFPKVSPQRFSAWFVLAALREFWAYGLHMPLHGDWSFTRDMEVHAIWGEFNRCVELARSRPVVSREVEAAVRDVWQQLYEESVEVANNTEAIELVLDADRLTTGGYKQADDEVEWLIGRFGYEKVAGQIARQVKLV